MTHDKVRQLRIGFAGPAAERVHIVHDVLPAALFAEVEPRRALGDRLAVAEVVVRHDQEAVRVQKARERLVAQRVLRHAMCDLQNAGRLPCGVPFDRVDGRPSVGGGKGKFFSILHSARLLCMI